MDVRFFLRQVLQYIRGVLIPSIHLEVDLFRTWKRLDYCFDIVISKLRDLGEIRIYLT